MSNSITSSASIDLADMYSKGLDSLSNEADAIQAAMDDIYDEDGNIDQEALLEVQFQMGQYNTKLETLSSMMNSIQDMLKTLAQRTG